jgi:hypothetical protein
LISYIELHSFDVDVVELGLVELFAVELEALRIFLKVLVTVFVLVSRRKALLQSVHSGLEDFYRAKQFLGKKVKN